MMKDTPDQTYYEILEIAPDATQEEIVKAYNRARSTYGSNSPALYSLFAKEEAQELLRLVEEAFAVLSNQFKRNQYDKQRHGGVGPVGASASPITPSKNEIPIAKSTASDEMDQAIPSAEFRVVDMSTSKQVSRPFEPIPESLFTVTSSAGLNDSSSEAKTEKRHKVSEPAFSASDIENNSNIERVHGRIGVYIRKAPEQEPGMTRFGRYNVDPAFEDEIKGILEFTGPVLNKIRLYKNITLDQISDTTRIGRPYLLALENDDFACLPAPVFVRGFLTQLAKVLGLNGDVVANSYMKLMKERGRK